MKAAAGEPDRFPWDRLMATGLGVLRLSPSHFWSMTPAEFRAATGANQRLAAAPRRADLAALLATFPDT